MKAKELIPTLPLAPLLQNYFCSHLIGQRRPEPADDPCLSRHIPAAAEVPGSPLQVDARSIARE